MPKITGKARKIPNGKRACVSDIKEIDRVKYRVNFNFFSIITK